MERLRRRNRITSPLRSSGLTLASAILLLAFFIAPVASPAQALDDQQLQAVDFVQYPGRQLPLDTELINDEGNSVRLKDCFRGKPVLLVPGYFRCRMLCEGVSDGLIMALQGNRQRVGPDFRVVFISIDPKEALSESQARKRTFLKRYDHADAADGCDFLSGSQAAISAVADSIGFRYRYDPQSGEYAHPAGFVVVRPDGKISRYFFGVSFSAGELDKSISAAARMEPPSVVERLLLLCFHYNPVQSRYGAIVINSVRVLGVATLAGLLLLVIRVSRSDESEEGTHPPTEPKP